MKLPIYVYMSGRTFVLLLCSDMITQNYFAMQTSESRIFVLITGPVFARTILCEVSWVHITSTYIVSHTEEYHGKQGDYTNKCTQVTACCQRWPTIRFICIDSYSYRR